MCGYQGKRVNVSQMMPFAEAQALKMQVTWKDGM